MTTDDVSPDSQNSYRIKYLVREAFPTFRSDVHILFGKYLPQFGLFSDYVAERTSNSQIALDDWGGGIAFTCSTPKSRLLRHFAKMIHGLLQVGFADVAHYSAVQVRDLPVTAFFAEKLARLKGLPFLYWMSFPLPEAQLYRAKSFSLLSGTHFWFPFLQAKIGLWCLYSSVLKNASHIFVQSEIMLQNLEACGIDAAKMTVVPMGYDPAIFNIKRYPDKPLYYDKLIDKYVLVYSGTQDSLRKPEFLLEMMAFIIKRLPDSILLMVGDTEDKIHKDYLLQLSTKLAIDHCVIWTGWLKQEELPAILSRATIGYSIIPRGFLLDCGSPTKVVEYMAIGLPVIANDQPEQAALIEESGAGLCVELSPEAFAQATVDLLSDNIRLEAMRNNGPEYIKKTRDYEVIAKKLAKVYTSFFEKFYALK